MRAFVTLLAVIPLVACASITTGTTQTLTIDTPYAAGSNCELSDTAGGHWKLNGTPSTVTINKGDGPMTIRCDKEGFSTGTLVLKEKFQGATLGNVLLGGGIGIIVDASTGAAQEYPKEAKVYMEKIAWNSPQEQQQWADEKLQYEKLLEESYKPNDTESPDYPSQKKKS